MNHRCWLNARHKFRLDHIHFDESVENRNYPLQYQEQRQVENVKNIYGKET